MARKLRDVRLAVHLPLRNRCDEDWQAMTPITGGRACAACERVVHDLSAMSEREAARFVARHAGQRVCMRYVARADGTIVYRQESSRLAPVLMVAALAACTPHEAPRRISGAGESMLEVPVSSAVIVPPAPLIEPPDDDINPCGSPIAEDYVPEATVKVKAKRGEAAKKGEVSKEGDAGEKDTAAAADKVEYVGFM